MQSDGTYKLAEPGDTLHGVAASAAVAGAQFFAIYDVGVEITLDYASFTVGGSVYVGGGGELVQTAAGFGRLGVATAANKVVLLSSGLMDLNDFESIMSASSTIHLIQSDISGRVKSEELEGLVNTILAGHGLITE
jgi:predicted ATP-dependent Lon-type protease